jgi:hypothetical protein
LREPLLGALLCLSACGGVVASSSELQRDASIEGGCAEPCDASVKGSIEALAEGSSSDATLDAALDSASDDASDAQEADSPSSIDAGVDIDAPGPPAPPTFSGTICHVVWPLAEGQSADTMSLESDPAGNFYVLIVYNSGAGIELGDASPPYAAGVALVKLDPQCQQLWIRALGGLPGPLVPYMSATMAVDSTSGVAIVGTFGYGNVDVGTGPVVYPGTNNPYTFAVRFDANGNQAFGEVFPYVGGSLVSARGGTTTLLEVETMALQCSGFEDSGFCADAGSIDAGPDFTDLVKLDGTGNELTRHPFVLLPTVQVGAVAPVEDPANTIWALEVAQGPVTFFARVTENGDPMWSQSASTRSVFTLGPSGNAIVIGSTATADAGIEMVQSIGPDGGTQWSATNAAPVAAAAAGYTPAKVAVDEAGTIYAGGFWAQYRDTWWIEGLQVLDGKGHLLRLQAWPGTGTYDFGTFAIDPSGNAMFGGTTAWDDGGSALFVAKVAP